MTDKQIIIDGVPVQDCCYFDYENDGYEDSCYIHQNECSAQNCYYKQLKRKEQECEELKKAIDRLLKIQYQLADSCNKYVQTLTEIKEIAEVEIECKTYEIENDCFNETRCKALKEHIDFTKQILQKSANAR